MARAQHAAQPLRGLCAASAQHQHSMLGARALLFTPCGMCGRSEAEGLGRRHFRTESLDRALSAPPLPLARTRNGGPPRVCSNSLVGKFRPTGPFRPDPGTQILFSTSNPARMLFRGARARGRARRDRGRPKVERPGKRENGIVCSADWMCVVCGAAAGGCRGRGALAH